MTGRPSGFVPPPYPYERLNELRALILERHDSVVDLSIGTPFDPPPDTVVAALGSSGTERSYPPSVGTPELHRAAIDWMRRRFDVDIAPSAVGATIGSKEFVASLPHLLSLRTPDRDTVLYPAISYPSYAMGATLASLRAVPVRFGADGRLDLTSIDPADVDRALLLWVNSPGNPTGHLDDLAEVSRWGRARGVPVFSDECYTEFTWSDRPRSILEHGDEGVVAVHSLSKRSNLAGVRVGFYAGDPAIVDYLREVRKHAGMMVPGPAQAAAVAALDDDDHVEIQRQRYHSRLERLATVIADWTGSAVELPAGAFYLWIPVDDGWAFTERFARDAGALVSPGEFYGPDGTGYVRVAVVQPDERINVVAERLGGRLARESAGAGSPEST